MDVRTGQQPPADLGIGYGAESTPAFQFRLELDLAVPRGDRALVAALEAERAGHAHSRPVLPT